MVVAFGLESRSRALNRRTVITGGRRHGRANHIPTRYPDAVGGSLPADNYAAEDSLQAVEDATAVVDFVQSAVEDGP